MKHPQTTKRTAEIKANLDALGDVSRWHGEIDDDTGELRLYLPPQFCLTGGRIVWCDMETSTKHDHALFEFLRDAPDQRGRQGKQLRAASHPRWNKGKIITRHGYVKVRVGRGHPLADPNGYAYEHLLVVLTSESPGAYLLRKHPDKWVIHHKNEDKTDNRIENLIVIERAEHNRIHNATRGRDERGRFVRKPEVQR